MISEMCREQSRLEAESSSYSREQREEISSYSREQSRLEAESSSYSREQREEISSYSREQSRLEADSSSYSREQRGESSPYSLADSLSYRPMMTAMYPFMDPGLKLGAADVTGHYPQHQHYLAHPQVWLNVGKVLLAA